MKKLLDETSDDLTRALLQAGRSHRPPAANQAKLLGALGVGVGVGLFSSKAFAWLGTSAGKLTLLGVSVGIAGSVWAVLPSAEPTRVEARSSTAASSPVSAPSAVSRSAVSSSAVSSSAVSSSAVSSNAVAALAPSEPNSVVPAPVAAAPSDPGGSSLAGSSVSNAVPARHAYAPVASEWRRRAAGGRKRIATRRDDAAPRLEASAEAPLSAAPASPPAVGTASSATASSAAGSLAAGSLAAGSLAAASSSPADAPAVRVAGLESEIQLVDAMRGAAQRNDTSALRRLVENYRGTFPEGQLRQEVSELALRTLSLPR
jgi:hypothetical protein